ncbi:MAG: hypothetical protein ABI790_10125 [Betaproteobacteria bacterium]
MASKTRMVATLVAAMMGMSTSAQAAADAELAEVRAQIRQLKEGYEARIKALEQRLQGLEAAARRPEPVATNTAEPAALPTPARATGEGAFNPAISVVLNGAYGNFSRDPDRYAVSGFVPANNGLAPGTRGLSLRESELAIAANIDPDFRGKLLLSFDAADAVGVEEAYVESVGLGHGLSFKGGRFFSAIGYQNEIHSHAWDFVDAPLVYRAFMTGENYADDGLQLKWLAPTDTLIELGGEIGRGKDRPGSNRNKNGAAAGTLFAHLGGDIGDSHSYRLGLSALRTSPREAQVNDVDPSGADVTNAFSGKTTVAGADFVYKYAPGGNATRTSLKLQGEYFRRRERGTLTYDVAGIAGLPPSGIGSDYATTQSGWYLQGVYQFMPQWRMGLRVDRLDRGTVNVGTANFGNLQQVDYNPSRVGLMFDYSPSEFTRFRLQFGQDRSRQDVTDNQIVLQYIFSLGAHGAHKF